jgi:Flp pilus assembly protein TadG
MIAAALRSLARLVAAVRGGVPDSKGNVAIILALALVPLIYLIGMGIDYVNAAYREDQLNADADAAALAAVAPAVMAQSDAASVLTAQNTFNAQAATLSNVTYSSKNLTVTVADSLTTRTVTVSYTAASQNAFPNILGQPTIALAGNSQAVATNAPNINFYLLLDDSPSMAIAATPSGITTMVNNTASQGGCAFGCHQSHPSSDSLGNPGGEDNYALARNLGVTLRIDMLSQAAQNLMTTAQQSENTTLAKYQMAIYSYDIGFNTIQMLTSNLATAQTSAANIAVLEVYANNWLTSSNNNSDEDTNYDNAMNNVNATMPNPGNGSNAKGDTPQEVVFFVTDGVEDEGVNGNRQQSVMDPTWCATIRNRGIRIAVLYTDYLPLPTNAWYNTWVAPFQSNIGPSLQSCASPGLYFEVQTGGDISAALSALFQAAITTAHLSQ